MSNIQSCTESRHKWTPTGGCKENPGYVGIGAAAISYTECCARCGARRQKVIGDVDVPTRNHGWRYS